MDTPAVEDTAAGREANLLSVRAGKVSYTVSFRHRFDRVSRRKRLPHGDAELVLQLLVGSD